MNKIFFFILCLFLFIGCSRQEEAGTQDSQEAQEPKEEAQGQTGQINIAPEPQEEKTKESVQDIAKMRNPFLTQEEEDALKQTGSTIPINYLVLSAVLYSPNASRAIINSQIVAVGDSIDNKKVTRIEPEAVILKDAQGEYIVRLKGVAGE